GTKVSAPPPGPQRVSTRRPRRKRRKGSRCRSGALPRFGRGSPVPTQGIYNHGSYGASLRWYIGMGVSDLEARFLSGETCAEEISELLRLETECCRSQLHLPPVGERDDRPELDRRNARAFSLHHQGAPGAHAHQALEERGRIPDAFSRHPGSLRTRRTPRPAPLSTTAELQGGSGGAFRVSEKLAAQCARGVEFRHESWFSDATWATLR